MSLLENENKETPKDLGYPNLFVDSDGNTWVPCAVQTDPAAAEYKMVVQPSTNNIPSV